MIEIDVTSPDTFPLAQARMMLPAGRRGARPAMSTLVRWIEVGMPGPGGEIVRLAAVRFGDRWLTSKAALQDFAERLTPKPRAQTRTPSQRQLAAESATRELEAAGI